MNLASINLNLLVALDALLSEAHVGRAARKIGLSQPAASHALRQLREILEDPLLVRVGPRMQLTPRASGLRESLAEALQRVEGLLAADSFAPERSSRRFSVMLQDHLAHLVVPALVKRVHEEGPGIQLEVLPWQSPVALEEEGARSIDLLVSCATHGLAGFERETLFKDTEVIAVGKGHPQASRLKKLQTFLEARHVAVVGRGQTEDPVDAWLRQEGKTRKVVLSVPSYVQALQAVAQTDLVAFVPKRLAESLARPLSLTLLRPPIDPGEYEEYLFYPRRACQDPGSVWLRSATLEIGAQIGRANGNPSPYKRPGTRQNA